MFCHVKGREAGCTGLHSGLVAVPEGAEILQHSASRIAEFPSCEREARQRPMEEHSPDFGDLDDRF